MKDPQFERLARKMLQIGGEVVQKGLADIELKKLLDRGREFPTKGLKIRRGRIGECHANVAYKYDPAKDAIVTGYALSDDAWHFHSWLLQDGRVVETTLKRDAYFGYELTPKEAKA